MENNNLNEKKQKMTFKTFVLRYFSAFLIIFGSFGLDRLTKFIVTKNMYQEHIELIKGFFSLTYCENQGAAWSLFTGHMIFFLIITPLALIAMIYYMKLYDMKKRVFYSLGLALIIGGTIGNFYDRLVNGYVVDFLDFIIFGYDFPVFNVADISMVVGVISLLLYYVLEIINERKKEVGNNSVTHKEDEVDDSCDIKTETSVVETQPDDVEEENTESNDEEQDL